MRVRETRLRLNIRAGHAGVAPHVDYFLETEVHVKKKSILQEASKIKKKLDKWLAREYPRGRVLTHANGPYAGRKCEIRDVVWNFYGDVVNVTIWVGAYRVDSKVGSSGEEAFIDTNDYYHRVGRGTYAFVETINDFSY